MPQNIETTFRNEGEIDFPIIENVTVSTLIVLDARSICHPILWQEFYMVHQQFYV